MSKKRGPVDLDRVKTPAWYKCGHCNARGVKLWREYNTCADYTELTCAKCTWKVTGKEPKPMNRQGFFRPDPDSPRTELSIGWRVPAVPTKEGDAFWGVCAGGEESWKAWCWWRCLPNEPGDNANDRDALRVELYATGLAQAEVQRQYFDLTYDSRDEMNSGLFRNHCEKLASQLEPLYSKLSRKMAELKEL